MSHTCICASVRAMTHPSRKLRDTERCTVNPCCQPQPLPPLSLLTGWGGMQGSNHPDVGLVVQETAVLMERTDQLLQARDLRQRALDIRSVSSQTAPCMHRKRFTHTAGTHTHTHTGHTHSIHTQKTQWCSQDQASTIVCISVQQITGLSFS